MDMIQATKTLTVVVASFFSGTAGFASGILMGLNPVHSGLASIVGNIGSVMLIVFSGSKFRNYICDRYVHKSNVRKKNQVKTIFDKYGIIGIGIAAPLISVTPVVIVGVALGLDSKKLALWTSVGILMYTFLLVVLSSTGLYFVRNSS
jgi:hypothetical protein